MENRYGINFALNCLFPHESQKPKDMENLREHARSGLHFMLDIAKQSDMPDRERIFYKDMRFWLLLIMLFAFMTFLLVGYPV